MSRGCAENKYFLNSKHKELFVERLKECMSSNNLTQYELCRQIGCAEASVSRYLSGTRVPPFDTILNMASFFNVSIDYLVGLSDVKCIAGASSSMTDTRLSQMPVSSSEISKAELTGRIKTYYELDKSPEEISKLVYKPLDYIKKILEL